MAADGGRLPPTSLCGPWGPGEPGEGSGPLPRKTESSKSCIRLQGALGTAAGVIRSHPALPLSPHMTQVPHFCTAFLTGWSDNPLEKETVVSTGMNAGYCRPWAPWPESQPNPGCPRPCRGDYYGRRNLDSRLGGEWPQVGAGGCSLGPAAWHVGQRFLCSLGPTSPQGSGPCFPRPPLRRPASHPRVSVWPGWDGTLPRSDT